VNREAWNGYLVGAQVAGGGHEAIPDRGHALVELLHGKQRLTVGRSNRGGW
jgi:hypothetical protein